MFKEEEYDLDYVDDPQKNYLEILIMSQLLHENPALGNDLELLRNKIKKRLEKSKRDVSSFLN